MTRLLRTSISLALLSVAIPLRAGNRPLAVTDSQTPAVWTNDDLEKLHDVPGLISIVGQIDEEGPAPESEPRPYVETQDPEWYAQQAANLSDELESRQAQLSDYLQAIEDARNLRDTTGGINFAEGAIAITLEDGIDLLEWRVEETQAAFDDLEDLARRNGIPPGTLRGQ